MVPTAHICARKITTGYGRTPVLRDFDFEANAGALTALIGPNGCGKSTLLKALSRNLPLHEGEVFLNGRPLHQHKSRDIAKQLAFLPQGPVAPEGLTVQELVAQGRFPHQKLLQQWSLEDARAVDQALHQTGLADFTDTAVTDLSGGQRQRAWIAMALAQQTPVVLLDEPTAFLDLKVQVDILSLLRKIAHEEMRTIVVVLHDLNIAASLADRMVMIRDGSIQADGPATEVFTAQNLSQVFGLNATILHDPDTGRPVCLPKITP